MSIADRSNLELVEDQYQRWRGDPNSVDERWQRFSKDSNSQGERRRRGKSEADKCRPLRSMPTAILAISGSPRSAQSTARPVSTPATFEFWTDGCGSRQDVRRQRIPGARPGHASRTAGSLQETYCRTVGVEYMHIQDTNVRGWLSDRIEPRRMRPELPLRQKFRVLMTLHYAELFERFLHTRYQGQSAFHWKGRRR